MTKLLRASLHLLLAAAVFVLGAPMDASAAKAGDVLTSPELRDGSDEPATIPDFGTKLLAIFYNDADEADMNDPLADALKAKKFDETVYRGIGIANLADSKAPNFIIRKVVRDKIEKYNATILTDPDRVLAKAWELGDCNNTSVFILVGADKTVKHVQRGAIRGADIDAISAMIEKLLAPPTAAVQ